MLTIAEIDKMNADRVGSNADCDIVLLYDYDQEKQCGEYIPVSKVSKISVTESILGELPQMTLILTDDGSDFHGDKFKFESGKSIYVKMSPHVDDINKPVVPYVSTIFVIQGVQYIVETASNAIVYTINCILPAFGYLNNICIWPKQNDILKHTSKSMVQYIAQQSGLKGASDISADTDDSMVWINSNMTGRDFIKHIVSHAWINKGDAPLYYIDKDGLLTYTSIKTMCDRPVTAEYVDSTYFDANKNQDGTTKEYKRIYNDGMIENRGFEYNEGGYTTKNFVYNPYGALSLNSAGFSSKFIRTAKNSKNSYLSCDTKKTDRNGSFIDGSNNATNAAANTTRYISNDIYFSNTHEHYDVAPLHNLNLIKGFFQVFAHIAVNSNMQLLADINPAQRVKLGDKIKINFATKAKPTSSKKGDFIVTALEHTYTIGAMYTILLTGVRDTAID